MKKSIVIILIAIVALFSSCTEMKINPEYEVVKAQYDSIRKNYNGVVSVWREFLLMAYEFRDAGIHNKARVCKKQADIYQKFVETEHQKLIVLKEELSTIERWIPIE